MLIVWTEHQSDDEEVLHVTWVKNRVERLARSGGEKVR